MIRDTNLSVEEKDKLTDLLVELKLIPNRTCQMIFHCADGGVKQIEYAQIKLK